MPRRLDATLLAGLAAAFAAAAIAAGWQVATRWGVAAALQPLDLALFRYGVPALVLAPLVLRRGWWPAASSPHLFAPMFLGAGLPFGLLAMSGAAFAPVSHMGALLPGTMPLFTALLAAALGAGALGRARIAGFVLVAAGVVLIVQPTFAGAATQAWIGDLLFLAASFVWAVYTVAFRASGLSAWHATALLSLASAALGVPLWLLGGGPARLAAVPAAEIALHVALQGIVAGLFGIWVYAVAVRRLGAARAALSGAAVPVLAALGGAVLLGEWPDALTALGIGLIVAGIAAAAPRRR